MGAGVIYGKVRGIQKGRPEGQGGNTAWMDTQGQEGGSHEKGGGSAAVRGESRCKSSNFRLNSERGGSKRNTEVAPPRQRKLSKFTAKDIGHDSAPTATYQQKRKGTAAAGVAVWGTGLQRAHSQAGRK